ADDAVTLQFFLDPVLAPESRSVDEHIFLSVMFDRRIDRIPGRPGNIGNDHTVFPKEPVNDRRFPDIRLPYYGDARTVILLPLPGSFREMLNHSLQHIPESQS